MADNKNKDQLKDVHQPTKDTLVPIDLPYPLGLINSHYQVDYGFHEQNRKATSQSQSRDKSTEPKSICNYSFDLSDYEGIEFPDDMEEKKWYEELDERDLNFQRGFVRANESLFTEIDGYLSVGKLFNYKLPYPKESLVHFDENKRYAHLNDEEISVLKAVFSQDENMPNRGPYSKAIKIGPKLPSYIAKGMLPRIEIPNNYHKSFKNINPAILTLTLEASLKALNTKLSAADALRVEEKAAPTPDPAKHQEKAPSQATIKREHRDELSAFITAAKIQHQVFLRMQRMAHAGLNIVSDAPSSNSIGPIQRPNNAHAASVMNAKEAVQDRACSSLENAAVQNDDIEERGADPQRFKPYMMRAKSVAELRALCKEVLTLPDETASYISSKLQERRKERYKVYAKSRYLEHLTLGCAKEIALWYLKLSETWEEETSDSDNRSGVNCRPKAWHDSHISKALGTRFNPQYLQRIPKRFSKKSFGTMYLNQSKDTILDYQGFYLQKHSTFSTWPNFNLYQSSDYHLASYQKAKQPPPPKLPSQLIDKLSKEASIKLYHAISDIFALEPQIWLKYEVSFQGWSNECSKCWDELGREYADSCLANGIAEDVVKNLAEGAAEDKAGGDGTWKAAGWNKSNSPASIDSAYTYLENDYTEALAVTKNEQDGLLL